MFRKLAKKLILSFSILQMISIFCRWLCRLQRLSHILVSFLFYTLLKCHSHYYVFFSSWLLYCFFSLLSRSVFILLFLWRLPYTRTKKETPKWKWKLFKCYSSNWTEFLWKWKRKWKFLLNFFFVIVSYFFYYFALFTLNWFFTLFKAIEMNLEANSSKKTCANEYHICNVPTDKKWNAASNQNWKKNQRIKKLRFLFTFRVFLYLCQWNRTNYIL